MTQPFGIDKEKLKQDYETWEETMDPITKYLYQSILKSLIPIPDCPHRWAGGGASEKKEGGCLCYQCKPPEKKDLIHTAFHAIDEIKEERCTKCNGVGKVLSLPYAVEPDTVCHHCNGTGKEPQRNICKKHGYMHFGACTPEAKVMPGYEGKEPRKEECGESVSDLHARVDANIISDLMYAEAKLSRYRTALEKISKSKPPHTHKELQDISCTALAEEDFYGESIADVTVLNNPLPKDQQKPQEQKEEEKVTPETTNPTSLMSEWLEKFLYSDMGGSERKSIYFFFQEKILSMLDSLKMEEKNPLGNNADNCVRWHYNDAVKEQNSLIDEIKKSL